MYGKATQKQLHSIWQYPTLPAIAQQDENFLKMLELRSIAEKHKKYFINNTIPSKQQTIIGDRTGQRF